MVYWVAVKFDLSLQSWGQGDFGGAGVHALLGLFLVEGGCLMRAPVQLWAAVAVAKMHRKRIRE